MFSGGSNVLCNLCKSSTLLRFLLFEAITLIISHFYKDQLLSFLYNT